MASRKPPRKVVSRTEDAREPVPPLDAYPVGGLPTNLDTDGEVTYPALVTEEAPQSETAELGDLERQEE